MTSTIRPAILIALLAALVAACSPSAASPSAAAPSGPVPATLAPASTPGPTAIPAPSTPGPASTGPSATAEPGTTVRAYFMLGSFTGGGGVTPVLRTVPETKAVAEAAMNALLEGLQGAELEASPAMYTAIPEGTRLLGLTIKDMVAVVTLSKAWDDATDNFQAGPAITQVVFTLTQFPTVEQVRIQVEGGSAGPETSREALQAMGLVPAIFVDHPAWGAEGGNPLTLAGTANVFEAVFRAQVLDADGAVLADEQVTATCGTGCWGTFKADIPYVVETPRDGTLRVFSRSAKDGTPENVVVYPVRLTPGG